MMAATSRLNVPSPHPPSSSRPSSSGSSSVRVGGLLLDDQKEIWSSLLKSVSSHKSTPTRNLLVMGIMFENRIPHS
jgi:hypothetical protein